MKRHVCLLAVPLLLLAAEAAHAQRCLPKMRGIELSVGMTDGFYTHARRADTGYWCGAALASYTKGGDKWSFGVEYLLKYNPYKQMRIPTAQFTAEGGFHYMFLADARKTVFCYMGGSALAGYETVNWGRRLLADGAALQHDDTFIYGGAATLGLEAYLADRIALLVNLRERCLWGGTTGHFHFQYGVGLKFIIN